MPENHLLAMTLYALLTAAFFGVLWRSGRRERMRYFALLFFALMLGSVALGWLMYRQGNAKRASDVLARAHTALGGNGEIAYHFAVVLNALGRRAEAKALLESALAIDQGFADALEARKLVAQW